MEAQFIETAGKIAGIGGLAIGAVTLLFRDFIRKSIFPSLTKEQAYRLLILFLVLTWSLGIAGIAAWLVGGRDTAQQATTSGDGSPIVQGVDGNVTINGGDQSGQ